MALKAIHGFFEESIVFNAAKSTAIQQANPATAGIAMLSAMRFPYTGKSICNGQSSFTRQQACLQHRLAAKLATPL